MASIDFVIQLLEAAQYNAGMGDQGNISPRCFCAADVLDQRRYKYASGLSQLLADELQDTYEVTNYPDIAVHLQRVVYDLLMYNDDAFVRISGFRLDEDDCRLYTSYPDLSPLGTFEDWLEMQEAGHGLFPTKGKDMSPAQAAAGWYFHYVNFLEGDKGSDVYPAIMRARISWGIAENKAPYWY